MPPRKRRRAMLIVAIIGLVLLVGGFIFYQYAQTYESTELTRQVCVHLGIVGGLIRLRVLVEHEPAHSQQ